MATAATSAALPAIPHRGNDDPTLAAATAAFVASRSAERTVPTPTAVVNGPEAGSGGAKLRSKFGDFSNTTAFDAGTKVGRDFMGIFAQIHGVGEIIRGNILAFMDSFAGGSSARRKDEDIARNGEREIRDRQFDKARTWRRAGAK